MEMTNTEKIACIHLRVMPSGWVLSVRWGTGDEDFRAWTEIIRAEILRKAFQGRDVLALTEYPRQSFWTGGGYARGPYPWARELARSFDLEQATVTHGRVEVHVTRIEACEPDLLIDAGTEEEFVRGLLWFSVPAKAMREQAAEILMTRLSSRTEVEPLCSLDYEVMSCEADGRWVVWCRPSLGLEPFVGWLRELCAKEGFQVAVDVG